MDTARYITKGQTMTASQFAEAIRKQIDEMLSKEYYSKRERTRMKSVTPEEIKKVSEMLEGLNDALLAERSVFALCAKEPRNLDSGNHYYEVYYVDMEGRTHIVWGGSELYWMIGQVKQDRDNSMRRYLFCSGAIGMSRLFDATDGLFTFLKRTCGTYAQIG